MIFPPLPQSGVSAQKRNVEDSVSSYFSSLPDRERDSLRDKDDQGYAYLSAQSSRVIEEASTPITKRNLPPILPERVEELKTLFNLSQVQLDTLRDQQSPQTQRVAQLLRSAQEDLAQDGQSSAWFDFNQQSFASAQSLVWSVRWVPPFG